MEWTTDKPRCEGYYWWRVNDDDEEIVQISDIDGRLSINYGYGDIRPVWNVGGQWAGPIPEPTEPQEAGR
jgi:hypothetical protein